MPVLQRFWIVPTGFLFHVASVPEKLGVMTVVLNGTPGESFTDIQTDLLRAISPI
ncbi:MAG: hypothetical protein WCQ63_02750 [Methanomethylophilus sp.]|nr:hypothetical protein [Methanomethylophilus sp.]